MRKKLTTILRAVLITTFCMGLASCDDPQVYGSVGFSNYHGGWGGPGRSTSVTIGGRIR